MEYRYSLIVSQYYHSRHMFIVKIDEKFIDNARKCVEKLELYKRGEDDTWKEKKIHLGDLDPMYCGSEMRCRYNVNDAGDIYFINNYFANMCMNDAFEYKDCSRRESAGYKRKAVLEDIKIHHDYKTISKIINKYFEIA